MTARNAPGGIGLGNVVWTTPFAAARASCQVCPALDHPWTVVFQAATTATAPPGVKPVAVTEEPLISMAIGDGCSLIARSTNASPARTGSARDSVRTVVRKRSRT